MEIERRFDQPTMALLQEIEMMLVDSCNGTSVQLSTFFEELYLKINNLKLQPLMLPDVVLTANQDHKMGIKRVTTINTICDNFNVCKFPKTMPKEVNILIHTYLTVHFTSVDAERSFSTLRCLKNYLRSTMSQKRLNHLLLLHTHKDKTDNLDIQSITREFISRNNRRLKFFGQ